MSNLWHRYHGEDISPEQKSEIEQEMHDLVGRSNRPEVLENLLEFKKLPQGVKHAIESKNTRLLEAEKLAKEKEKEKAKDKEGEKNKTAKV